MDAGDTDVTVYAWDYRNRLTEVTHYSTYANYAVGASDKIVEYAYDSFNHLIGRVIDADGSAGAGGNAETVYAYDGDQIALQFDHAGSGDATAAELSHRYFWNAQAVDQLFAEEQTHYDSQQAKIVSDAVLWALTDHENSIRDLAVYNSGTDATTVADHRIYDAYGNLTSETAAVDCVFGYTGRQTDAATGLQNNMNRWYDPSTGRWISQDPIGFSAGDANLYRYVNDSPLDSTDPSGLCRRYLADMLASGMGQSIMGLLSGLAGSLATAMPGAGEDNANNEPNDTAGSTASADQTGLGGDGTTPTGTTGTNLSAMSGGDTIFDTNRYLPMSAGTGAGYSIDGDGNISFPDSSAAAREAEMLEASKIIQIPEGSLIAITDRAPKGDFTQWSCQDDWYHRPTSAHESMVDAAPKGTPIIDNISRWPDLNQPLANVPDGSLNGLVLNGHGDSTGVACSNLANSLTYVNLRNLEDTTTLQLIQNKLAPGAPVILFSCSSARNAADMQDFANLVRHPVTGNPANVTGRRGEVPWVTYYPQ